MQPTPSSVLQRGSLALGLILPVAAAGHEEWNNLFAGSGDRNVRKLRVNDGAVLWKPLPAAGRTSAVST